MSRGYAFKSLSSSLSCVPWRTWIFMSFCWHWSQISRNLVDKVRAWGMAYVWNKLLTSYFTGLNIIHGHYLVWHIFFKLSSPTTITQYLYGVPPGVHRWVHDLQTACSMPTIRQLYCRGSFRCGGWCANPAGLCNLCFVADFFGGREGAGAACDSWYWWWVS